MTDALLVALGAAVGAPLRWLTDRLITARYPSRFPWGTLCVNLAGSFVLGVVLGSAAAPDAPLVLLLGTGFCGAFTTFSTFSFETVRLIEAGPRRYAAWNLVVSLVVGVLLATLGWGLGTGLG